MLAYLRKGDTFAELAAGFGVGTTTAWRYVEETVALLAARAPKLREAIRDAKKAGCAYVYPRRHPRPDRPGRRGPAPSTPASTRSHGMNLQVMAGPGGDVLWVSGALPGSVHQKKAEGVWGVLDEPEKSRPGHPGR